LSDLFDDTEPEEDAIADAMQNLDRIETFRTYVRDGMDELQGWLREQPSA
jgi:hypothetical protein